MADSIMLTAFAIEEAARWDQGCLVAALPAEWLQRFDGAYQRPGYSLPSRGLEEIIFAVDPAVMHVGGLRSETFVVAFPGVDRRVLTAAIAAWATTQITADIDWFQELESDDLEFVSREFNVVEHQPRRNDTAAPAAHVYDMLPTFVARHVAVAGLTLLGKPQQLILGPPQRNNRRDVVIWPPIRIEDRAGEGLVTAKISFHVETVPNQAQPHLHADLSMSRFPLTPVTYVPNRGATMWLHAPNGFLREKEPHTLLAAPVQRRPVKDRDSHWQWQWGRGLGEALAKLTHLPFPAPDKVFAAPATAASEGAIRAYVLYSGGTTSEAVDDDVPAGGAGKSKSLLHAARTGFVPGDHIEVHERLAVLLEPLGIRPTGKHPRAEPRRPESIQMRFDPERHYTIELWTHSDLTKNAVLATLEHHFRLTRADDAGEPGIARYTGDLHLEVRFHDGTDFATGIQRERNRSADVRQGQYANQVERELGDCTDPRVAILELQGARHFAQRDRIDPKAALRKGFARSGRSLQCLQPAILFKPPTTWREDSKRPRPTEYPGTAYGQGTIHRCAAAINDALRQLGRIGTYEIPVGLPELDHIGIWLHVDGNVRIPLAIRHHGVDEPTASLVKPDGSVLEMPYHQLPRALARGIGRIKPGPEQEPAIAEFLTSALGLGETPQTHDRIVFVRAASFRHRGWDWLQDKHLTPDALIRPGVEIDDEEVPATLTPADCPGLRIVRIREAGTEKEVARAFGAEPDIHAARIHGLFGLNERVFYGQNPKSDQMRTRLDNTKLDPDLHSNFTRMVANPQPVELTVAFQQPGDDTAALAALTNRLRRAHAHTSQDTVFPGVLHLCSLASEYL
jgi:hypothetical protein